ncbi:MAG: hypothetical protein ACXAE3_05985 [Candidatus Kariarchaeaceae archaeon]
MSDDLFALTIMKLMEVANEDGFVSSDEIEIIKQAEVDVDSYTTVLKEALADGIIDEKEKTFLDELKSLIIERAETIATLDDVVSDDEKAMLSKLSEILAKHYK